MKEFVQHANKGQSIRKRLGHIYLLMLSVCLSGIYAQDTTADNVNTNSEWPVFDAIKVSGVAKVFFTQGETQEITMNVSGDPYPQLIRSVKNGVLEVSTKGEARNEVVEVYITNPKLKFIQVADRAEFHSTNGINGPVLEIFMDDVGSANITVEVEELTINMRGGDLVITGKAEHKSIVNSRGSDRGTLEDSGLVILN